MQKQIEVKKKKVGEKVEAELRKIDDYCKCPQSNDLEMFFNFHPQQPTGISDF